MTSHSTIDITLQGREYRVTCPPKEREALLAAVAHVEARMAEMATKTRGSNERLAVMVALNLAHELLDRPAKQASETLAASGQTQGTTANSPSFDTQEFARRIEAMQARLDAAMVQQDSLL